MRYLDISPENLRDAEMRLKTPREVLGQLAAMSVSGNDVSGSVFYAFPLVFAAAGEPYSTCPQLNRVVIFSRDILASLFANGFFTPPFLPAAPARARLDRSPQRIVRHIPKCSAPTLMPPSLQELRLSLAILGEDASSRWGSCDSVGRGGYVHCFSGYSQCLS